MWKKKQTEEPKNKDITRESYLQTVFRRFRPSSGGRKPCDPRDPGRRRLTGTGDRPV